MTTMVLKWKTGATGGRAEVGSLLRWKTYGKRSRWEYGYYRGPDHGALTFSLTPDGPIVLWTAQVMFAQVAVVIPESQGSDEA